MQKKNIFKTVALAMLMPAMLLTTACSSEDDVANTSNITNKGYALPVTVNATRGGDATRATFDGSKLNFSTDDKLFVYGSATAAGSFAGALDYVPATGKFSGTIYTQEEWTGTADALFTAANEVTATLLPNGYDANGSNSFLYVDNKNTDIAYDDRLTVSGSKAFVASETAKATGVEQLSLERASTYSSGFALAPGNAILNFTITGLEAGAKDVLLHIHHGFDYDVFGSVTPTSGVATFAIGVPVGANIKDMENNLTVGSSNFTLPSSTTFAAGKIYNITRNAIPGALIGQFTISDDNGEHTRLVYFSKGNLQATTTDMGTSWTWAFAEQQWSYVGNAAANFAINGNKSVSENGTVDLFGWSTEENYLGIHLSEDDGYNSGDFFDWGSHADVIEGIGSGWSTLSKNEWTYLFNIRSASTVGTTEDARYAKAKVNTVQGIILFPDTYTHPDGVTAPVGVNEAEDDTGWNDNNYSSADWTKMESAGCVFLPAAGYRDWGVDVFDDGDDGYYWSSTADGNENAHYVYFSSSDLVVDEHTTSRYNGHSVRLVRPVQ